FLERIRKMIHTLRTATQEKVIGMLNPQIAGWANYHRHIVAKDTFSQIDNSIWRALWNWACRRHPNKGRRWIYSRYFHRMGNHNGVFSCNAAHKDGSEKQLCLKK